MKYYFTLLLFLGAFCHHFPLMAQQDKDLQNFYADKLKANGVFVSSDISRIPYVDIDKMAKNNFDTYRGYGTRQQVVLKHGPTIELASIQERIASGQAVDTAIISRKRSFPSGSYRNQSMPIVDIGMGIKAPERQKDVVRYTAVPKD